LQRGLSHFYHVNKADRDEAIRLFREAIALDPEFAAARAHLADALSRSKTIADAEDMAKALASARTAAEQAVSLDPNDPVARYVLGRMHIYAGEIEMAIGEMQTAIAINPNFARGHYGVGFAHYYGAGQAEQSLPYFDTALRLSPRDPSRWVTLMMKGSALRELGRNDEAIAHCRQACQIPDSGFLPHMHLGAALAEAGKTSEAQAAFEKAMHFEPALSISFIRSRFPGVHETTSKSLLDSLRKAGLPE
jgi:adenylate cyclase